MNRSFFCNRQYRKQFLERSRIMYSRFWIAVNIFLISLSFVYIWFFRSHDSSTIVMGQVLAQIGILLFIINVNMYFILLVIRKTPQRNIKISLAKFSRKMMKWHIRIASSGTIFIVFHAWIMINTIGATLGYNHLKLVSGYMSIFSLSITLLSGYLRHKKASGYRRKFHLISAMTFAVISLFHLFY